MRALMFGMMMISAEYAAPDGSFKIRVPERWRVLTMTFVEPSNGGEERIVMGAGIPPFSARSLFDTERPERMELVLSGGSLRDVHNMRVPARLVASLWKVDDRATRNR